MSSNFLKTLQDFGTPSSGLLRLDRSIPAAQNYLNLLNINKEEISPDYVLEVEGKALLYIVNAANLSKTNISSHKINELRNILSCRGEQSVLAVVKPGELNLFSINIECNNDQGKRFSDVSKKIISELVEGTVNQELSSYLYGTGNKKFLYDLLFKLLKDVGQSLNGTLALAGKHETIISLIGRALFTRFLIDRDILTSSTAPSLFKSKEPLISCFSSPENCLAINQWLDQTFNGDLLPLDTNDYESWFTNIEFTIFTKLSMILNPSDKNGQLYLPTFVNFSHVPVGLLSEVYEAFLHENLDQNVRKTAKSQSVHYTPYQIANYMFEETLSSVDTCEPHLAKVLDPSCGAGVFLITSFRKLVQEHWKVSGKRPDTFKIREILYNQITGFDINKNALNLSALGLYLSAIELDAEPLPTSKLKFNENLIGNILIHSLNHKELKDKTPILGSLGSSINNKYNDTFDIVIGNPPWTSLEKALNPELSNIIRSIAKKRSNKLSEISKSHNNPDQVPDLPFVWRSLEWAKKGGNIALALHSRFLFKTSKIGIQSRNDLFKATNVTGILNATALRQTKVWEGHNAQFCLFFAKNEMPKETDFFYFISPQYQKHFSNVKKQIKIDYSSAEPIQPTVLFNKPFLLKTLFKGTALDVHVIDQVVNTKNTQPLKKYWDETVGKGKNGQGYKVATRVKDATNLLNLNAVKLTTHDNANYIIKTSELSKFDEKWLEAPRKNSIYLSPLVLINKAIGGKPETISARINLDPQPVAYNESFYGYSATGFHSPELLSKYIFALFNSKLFLYFCLMTSSEYGIEREAIQKADVDIFPIVEFDALTDLEKQSITDAFESFKHNNSTEILDKLICSIYKLSEYDIQTINDTLAISLPIARVKEWAEAPVSPTDIKAFCHELSEAIAPLNLNIKEIKSESGAWNLISVSTSEQNPSASEDLLAIFFNKTSISKVIEHQDNIVYIGMLNQNRYWTKSRARLLAIELQKDLPRYLGEVK